MQPPREIVLSAALIAIVTVLYLLLAATRPVAASGLPGHMLGVTGLLAMVAGTIGYTWRKRRDGPGSMHAWLQAHVVTGIVGPYVILLHTAFAFRGLAGASFVVMAVCVLSGVIGRFVYTAVPKVALHAADAPLTPVAAGGWTRRIAAVWWLFHVPMAYAMFALAVVHVCAALYYATFSR